MTERSATEDQAPVRVLFLAWGDSIHARRRIQAFAEDERFRVELVSNYRYRLEGVRSHPLLISQPRPSGSEPMRRFAGISEVHLDKLNNLLARYPLFRSLKDFLWLIPDLFILRRVCREFRPQVVFLQTLLYPSYLAFGLPRHYPLVITFWNGDVTWWAKWNGVERWFKRWIVTYGTRRAAAITVNSGNARQACLGYGASAERVYLIRYPGVDLDRFTPGDRQIARQQLGLEGGPLILCPRGLADYLNNDVMLRAAAKLFPRYPGMRVVFLSGAATPEQRQPLQSLATELGLSARVSWQGQVPWEEMPLWYRAVDLVVSLASKDSLPNCVLEAQACGTPVVVGDIPQLREWVVHDENGLLCPTRDHEALVECLVELLEGDEEWREGLCRSAREQVVEHLDAGLNRERVRQLVLEVSASTRYG